MRFRLPGIVPNPICALQRIGFTREDIDIFTHVVATNYDRIGLAELRGFRSWSFLNCLVVISKKLIGLEVTVPIPRLAFNQW